MKQITAYLLIAILAISCGPTIYKSKTFEQEQNKIKILAILPFNTTIDSKRLPKGVTIETLKESQEKVGYDVQSNVYSAFLHKQDNYTVQFQDIDRTNAILKKNNIQYQDIAFKEKGELCSLLGVDGIISGKITMSKPMSEGAAVTVGLLVGAWGATNKADVALTIHQKEGNLLWKYDYAASGSVGSSAENLAKGLMRNVSKKFPYRKSK